MFSAEGSGVQHICFFESSRPESNREFDRIGNQHHGSDEERPGRRSRILFYWARVPTRAVIAGYEKAEKDDHQGSSKAPPYGTRVQALGRDDNNARALYDKMLELYPDRANPGSVWGSAHAVKRSAIVVKEKITPPKLLTSRIQQREGTHK